MISRSGTFPLSLQPALIGGSDEDAERLPLPSGTAARSPGTALLVSALTPKVSLSPAAVLEHAIRNSPAYQRLSPGDRGVSDWIMWRASLAEPGERLYYLGKLDTLFKTRYEGHSGSAGAAALAKATNAEIDASLARERARGNVFKGDEELQSAGASLSTRRGEGGTLYRVDARDPRSVVVKLKVHLKGDPVVVAKVKEFEDSIEKRASTRGYVVDVEFANKGGADVFDVQTNVEQWATSRNWAGGIDTLAHELHHLLGLEDRYDYIESHSGNKFLPVSERLYLFAYQMLKPPDPRGSSSLMGDPDAGTVLSEDVCAVVKAHLKECIDARKEFDPEGLPAYGSRPVH